MSKDSSDLFTGITSSTATKIAHQRKAQQLNKQKEVAEALPIADVEKKAIQVEREKIEKIGLLNITAETDPQSLLIELLARKKYLEHLNSREARLSGIERIAEKRSKDE